MTSILKNEKVSVETDCDRVIFAAGRTLFPIPYATAFKMAASLKMACKQAMRITKEPLSEADALMKSDREIKVNEVSPIKRNLPIQNFEWGVSYCGEMVYMEIGNNEVGFHFSDGLKISQWLRFGGKQAKNWAGDTSRSMHATGILTDAEDNYKRGYQ